MNNHEVSETMYNILHNQCMIMYVFVFAVCASVYLLFVLHVFINQTNEIHPYINLFEALQRNSNRHKLEL